MQHVNKIAESAQLEFFLPIPIPFFPFPWSKEASLQASPIRIGSEQTEVQAI